MTVDEAYSMIACAIDSGHPAHGYLIVGDVRMDAMRLAVRILQRIFCKNEENRGCGECDECRHITDRVNPDVHWLMPEKKSRVVSVGAMREKMLEPMEKTSFAGGWKAGVVVAADRMNQEAANAFLKLLEEPTPNTLFLLITDSPDALLPTIISRCQTVDVSNGKRRTLREPFRMNTLRVFSSDRLTGIVERQAAAMEIAEILAELKALAGAEIDEESKRDAAEAHAGEELSAEQTEAVSSARYLEYRHDLVILILSWFRDLLAVRAGGGDVPLVNDEYRALLFDRAANISLADAMRNVTAVEEFALTLDRHVQEDAALSFLFDRVNFGAGEKTEK